MRQGQKTTVCTENSQAFWDTTKGYSVCLLRIYQTSSRIACQVSNFSIPQHLNDQIEQVQRRTLRIALPHLSYSDGLEAMNIQTLNQRREDHCHKLYKNIFIQEDNKLKYLIPVPKLHKYSLGTPRTFDLIKCRTEIEIKSYT